MNIRVKTVLLFFLLFFLLIGCTEDTNAYIQDPISLSGDTAYYAAMDSDLRKTVLRMKHIEVSGIVSAGGYTTIFVGDEKQDGICFFILNDAKDLLQNVCLILHHGDFVDPLSDVQVR